MKILKIILVIISCLLVAGAVSASSWTLMDNYIGNGDFKSRDRIGNKNYEIYSLSLNHTGNLVEIDIFTRYNGFGGRNLQGTEMGDFFISTGGYSPFGPAPYMEDNYSNGEKWEYAFVFDNHDIHGKKSVSNGYFSLYKIDPDEYVSQIITSNEFHRRTNGIRKNQEVRLDVSEIDALVTGGTWDVDRSGIHLSISDDFFDGLNIDAVRWQMTCANDIIEASVPVPNPEPATMLLFGFGLLWLAGLGRRKKRNLSSASSEK